MRRSRTLLGIVAFALFAAACGSGTNSTSTVPTDDLAPIAGACSIDDPDCVDTAVAGEDEPLFLDDEPTDGVTPAAGMVAPGGGVTVGEALTTDATGVLAVTGFVVAGPDGALLCSLLAESLPPQCGGDVVALDGLDSIDPTLLQESQGVTWTNEAVTLFGEIVDGTLVVDPLVSG